MKKQYFLVLVSLVILLASCTKKPELPITIHLVETTDVHGTIFPMGNQQQSLAHVSYWVDSMRNAVGHEHVVLLDNGDILQGTPLVYVANFVDTLNTHWTAKALNEMQYDAAAVGNHDIEAGHPVYDRYNAETEFPLLAANALNSETGEPYFQPYAIIEKAGLKIAVLGLITPGVPGWLPESLYSGITFEDMVESAEKWVPKIMQEEQPDMLVGLFHAGGNAAYGGEEDTYMNENGSILVAEKVPGFDVVFLGHDHRKWNTVVQNETNGEEVLIIGAGSRNKQLGHVAVTFTDSGKIFIPEIIELENRPADSAFINKFSAEKLLAENFINEPIGRLTEPMSSENSFWEPTAFIDLIHKVQLDETDADISITAPLSYRTHLPADTLFRNDLFDLYRYENYINGLKMYGNELDAYLEYSYAGWFQPMESADDNALKFALDEEGNLIYSDRYETYQLANRYYNFDAAAGIRYTVDLTEENGQRVEIHQLSDGRNFHPDTLYTVAVNSYRASGGGGHFEKGAGLSPQQVKDRTYYSSKRDLRHYLAIYLQEHSPYTPQVISTWKVLPEHWLQQAKQKDKKMLFGD
ncbi:MAG: bifunctional metallophosphatase/5'-nucleotidase [Bacteroidota bacterium]